MEDYRCDVLVIGAGGAGLRAAIAASDRGAKILLVTKGTLGKSGVTAKACSDRMAFHATLAQTEPGGSENWRYHAEDIYRIGGYVSDEDLAQILAKGSKEAFHYLDQLGVPWVKNEDGEPDQFVTDGSRFARACYTGPRTANHIEDALVSRLRSSSVQVLEHVMLADLVLDERQTRIEGAIGVSEKSGETVTVQAKAVVLATGGGGQTFKITVFPEEMTGDGYAMAYRAGAQLVNMEFIQIGLSSVKTKLACSGSMMRALPRIVNERDEEILPHYFPKGTPSEEMYNILFDKGASWPLSLENPSHVIDIAITREMSKGHTVFLDYSRDPQEFQVDKLGEELKSWYQHKGIHLQDGSLNSPVKRLQAINKEAIEWLKKDGIDLKAGESIEVAPAIQHFQGGVKIREKGQTTVQGLYAAGECAGGQHGANRPGGNSLLDGQVFGKITGEEAAVYTGRRGPARVSKQAIRDFDSLLKGFERDRGLPASTARRKAQEVTYTAASVIRTAKGLEDGLNQLKTLEKESLRRGKESSAFALETRNILIVGQLVLSAARLRQESRGPHLFFAHPDDATPVARDDKHWRKYIVIQQQDAHLSLTPAQPVRLGD